MLYCSVWVLVLTAAENFPLTLVRLTEKEEKGVLMFLLHEPEKNVLFLRILPQRTCIWKKIQLSGFGLLKSSWSLQRVGDFPPLHTARKLLIRLSKMRSPNSWKKMAAKSTDRLAVQGTGSTLQSLTRSIQGDTYLESSAMERAIILCLLHGTAIACASRYSKGWAGRFTGSGQQIGICIRKRVGKSCLRL